MNPIKLLKQYQADIILALAVVLISVTAFNLGKISETNRSKTPITIKQPDSATKQVTSTQKPDAAVGVVASKNSAAKVYHFSWCSGALKISEKNKITFATEATAISAGYTLAGNCQK